MSEEMNQQKRHASDEGNGSSRGEESITTPVSATPQNNERSPKEKRKRARALVIFVTLLGVAAIGGLMYWLHARDFESTDDAQINGNLSPIGTRINGTVIKVFVQNDQAVRVGDPLVDLDPRDDQAKLDQAQAQVAQAQSALLGDQLNISITEVQNSTNILAAKADVASAQAAVAAAERDRDQAAAQVLRQKAADAQAQNDLKRYRILAAKQEISRSDFDQYESNAKQQAANLQATRAALRAAAQTVNQRNAQLDQAKSKLIQDEKNAAPKLSIRRASVEQQQASLEKAEARLEQAKLNLNYTKIVAPVDGIVMQRSAQVGARVTAGQQLLTISQIGHLWVTANFKETQLLHMRPGQRATIHVDALDRDFKGVVKAIGGATGSISSVLPPENATGNYVKVVQRIPVRINLNPGQSDLDQLRPGMSVEPTVRVN